MTLVDKWQYEMMSTAELANECRLLKEEWKHYDGMRKLSHGLPDEYASYRSRATAARAKFREVEKILKSRQLKLL